MLKAILVFSRTVVWGLLLDRLPGTHERSVSANSRHTSQVKGIVVDADGYGTGSLYPELEHLGQSETGNPPGPDETVQTMVSRFRADARDARTAYDTALASGAFEGLGPEDTNEAAAHAWLLHTGTGSDPHGSRREAAR